MEEMELSRFRAIRGLGTQCRGLRMRVVASERPDDTDEEDEGELI
jgi:hypothetical protein